MGLRKHQKEFADAVRAICLGRDVKTILVKVTPGGGKSAIPLIATRLIDAGVVDKVSWTVPRQSLQYQGEGNFTDPFFRSEIKHRHRVRVSTNDYNPCRGLSGFITTYQAVGVENTGSLTADFELYRYALVLDEFHHAELNGVWHKALQPLVDRCKVLILMTGTLERGDRKKIAFIPYKAYGQDSLPDLDAMKKNGAVIEYGRVDALKERAILPITFTLLDAAVEYKRQGEERVRHASMKKITNARDASAALYTVLRTEFAEHLLGQTVSHLGEYQRKTGIDSRLLVVTAEIETAREALAMMATRWPSLRTAIATSHDSPEARQNIDAFKAGRLDALVTIAMAYEGLDVPQVSHIASLTHIRSVPWIEQMIARSVRIDRRYRYEQQGAYVFAPDDYMMKKVVKKIQREQLPFAKGDVMREGDLFGGSGFGKKSDIIPIGSQGRGQRLLQLGDRAPMPAQDDFPVPETPSEQEKRLRDEIDGIVRRYCAQTGTDHKLINRKLKQKFKKPRKELTLPELERCRAYARATFRTASGSAYRQAVDVKAIKPIQPIGIRR